MSSSRVVRGTKGRIIFCVCAIFIVVAIIACYNNTLSQLDEVRKTSDQCHQQQENLSTQLQVIFDYKQRLEKSLKTEKAEHQQTKKVLEAKIDEEHSKNEKSTNEANLKLSSLQQHYNLLKTQHDDFKEECSKTQQQQLDEINILQAKLQELQGQLKKSVADKENAFEALKSQYMQLQVDKENLEQQIHSGQNKDVQMDSDKNHLIKVNHELQREFDELKAKCSITTKVEELQMGPQNQINPPSNISNNVDVDHIKQPAEIKDDLVNVADIPSNIDEEHQVANEQLIAPRTLNPLKNDPSKDPTKTSTTAKGNLAGIQPLHIPIVSVSNSLNNKPSEETHVDAKDQHVLPIPQMAPKVPSINVVPAPENNLETSVNVGNKPVVDEKDVREDVNNAFPNRYRTNLIINEIANEAKAKEADKQRNIRDENKEKHIKADTGDADNAAVEEIDPPVVNNIEPADPFALDENRDSDKVNIIQQPQSNVPKQQHINALAGEHLKLSKHGHKVYADGADGLEYDKDIQNGVPVEENDPEAEDDDPDYADPIARQKDVAIRN